MKNYNLFHFKIISHIVIFFCLFIVRLVYFAFDELLHLYCICYYYNSFFPFSSFPFVCFRLPMRFCRWTDAICASFRFLLATLLCTPSTDWVVVQIALFRAANCTRDFGIQFLFHFTSTNARKWCECVCVIWLRSAHTTLKCLLHVAKTMAFCRKMCVRTLKCCEIRGAALIPIMMVWLRSSTHPMFARSHSLIITNEWKSWRQCHIDYSAQTAKWALLISPIFRNIQIFSFCAWIPNSSIDDDEEATSTRVSWLTRDLRVKWHLTMSWKWNEKIEMWSK